jgi:hypothetical protein
MEGTALNANCNIVNACMLHTDAIQDDQRTSIRCVLNYTTVCFTGDKVQHIMWRLLNGGLPRGKPPKVVVVHAGADDVALPDGCRADVAEATGAHVINLLQYIRNELPTSHIIVMALLPQVRLIPPSLLLCLPVCISVYVCL